MFRDGFVGGQLEPNWNQDLASQRLQFALRGRQIRVVPVLMPFAGEPRLLLCFLPRLLHIYEPKQTYAISNPGLEIAFLFVVLK